MLSFLLLPAWSCGTPFVWRPVYYRLWTVFPFGRIVKLSLVRMLVCHLDVKGTNAVFRHFSAINLLVMELSHIFHRWCRYYKTAYTFVSSKLWPPAIFSFSSNIYENLSSIHIISWRTILREVGYTYHPSISTVSWEFVQYMHLPAQCTGRTYNLMYSRRRFKW